MTGTAAPEVGPTEECRNLMVWSGSDASVEGRRYARALRGVAWLRRHRDLVVALAVAGVAVSFALDLLIPGYAIAGFYLLPILLVAFALRERRPVVSLSLVCLGLTVVAMLIQGRGNVQNIVLVLFGAVAGAGLIALGYLYNRYDLLYERERATTARMHSLTAQLQRLQEVSVLDSDLPLSELLLDIVVQARQLLGSDGGRLFRLESAGDVLTLQAAAGLPGDDADDPLPAAGSGPLGRALASGRPVAEAACLAVPLTVRDDVFGVIALDYNEPPKFTDDDLGVATSFGDQAALAIENARLREQMERSAVAAERSRLARELHDSVTQSLFAASLTAEALAQAPDHSSAETRRGLRDVETLTRGALAEMRTLLLEMRPGALAQSHLGDLLEHLVQATQARTRTTISLTVCDTRPLPADVTVALYRIAQEALNNVVRHSGAVRARAELTGSNEAVELVVGDDGKGFDPAAVGPEQLGLRIMRERAEAVGGGLEIDSEVGRGTVVTVTWSAGRR